MATFFSLPGAFGYNNASEALAKENITPPITEFRENMKKFITMNLSYYLNS